MAKFLTTRGCSSCIEDIIRNTKNKFILISPYVKLPKILFDRLGDADKRNIQIIFVCKPDGITPEHRMQLQQLKNLSLYFLKNLHAKVYLNEDSIVITSMNLYEYSEQNNWEIGILITKIEDGKLFEEVATETKSIINTSTKAELITKELNKDSIKKSISNISYTQRQNITGFCIRCKRSIPYNLDKPHCWDCFLEWMEWENPEYIEPYCHTCGKRYQTTKLRPQCLSCYSKSQR